MGFYEVKKQENLLPESQKPLILLGFSKSSVSPFAPNAHNPNRSTICMVGESFGFCVFFDYPNFNSKQKNNKRP